jgi:hypothetical protein
MKQALIVAFLGTVRDRFTRMQDAMAFCAAHICTTGSALQTADDLASHRPGSDNVLSWKDLESWLFPSN